jgi:hypothetical protein
LTERKLFFRKFDLVSDLFHPIFTTSLLYGFNAFSFQFSN